MTDPREARPVTSDPDQIDRAALRAAFAGDCDDGYLLEWSGYEAGWNASRASQSARIAALEAALRRVIATLKEPNCDMQDVESSLLYARAALAGETP